MRKGFEYTAVVVVDERDIMKTFRPVKEAFGLTFDDYRCGFYGRKSVFQFRNQKHYKMFVLHCNLSGIAVHDSIDDAVHALVAQ